MAHQHVVSDYMEHGACFSWEPGLVALHVISDIVTGIAYFSIPAALFYFAYKRRDLPFHGVILLFGIFILACGTSHFLAAYTVYVADYWIEGGVKAFTALISAVAAFYMIPLIPDAIAMPSLTKSLKQNKELNAQLERKLDELNGKTRELMETNRELNLSESRFRVLVEHAPDAIVVYDATQNRFVDANANADRLFGCSREELLASGPPRFYASAQPDGFPPAESMEKMIERALAGETLLFERAVHNAEGKDLLCEVRLARLPFTDRNLMRGSFIDITERKKLEERLRQSQKMESVGRLAGGIAHDFNNLLTVITGYSELMLSQLEERSPLVKEVEEIKRAGERASSLTQQLLAFSRRQVLQPRVIDLNEVVSRVEKMLRRLIGEDVELRTVPGAGLWSVKADPGQIEQVLVNLVVNARDAMPGGGVLTIETGNVFLDEEYSLGHLPAQSGHYVMLAVSDTGVGMDERTKSQVFEPFFTTKESGKGTGLGLSTVYGIVKQSGGYIWVYSEPGKGSTFKVYIPRTEEREDGPRKAVPPVEDLRGEKTVLIVEDEESILKLSCAVLGGYGYAVLAARGGEDGLRIAGKHEGEISLLLTDVVMPGMGGRELYERILQQRPKIKVLYMSGYTDKAIVRRGVLDPGTSFLQKPFSPISLARKVKEVLEPRA
ncbi:hybrid sensor histidine kinase/response regulator [Candidatus Deferrimicrobium sp.]|uniref:hybrid sensor histidine kinase/response regulator n=1 Tax=Candidatus Deferrimicrobium sp. TaxID=3060586 RepID=UPI002EDB378C